MLPPDPTHRTTYGQTVVFYSQHAYIQENVKRITSAVSADTHANRGGGVGGVKQYSVPGGPTARGRSRKYCPYTARNLGVC